MIILGVLFLILEALTYGIVMLIGLLSRRLLQNAGPKWKENWIYLMIITGFIGVFVFAKLGNTLITPILKNLPADTAQVKKFLNNKRYSALIECGIP